MAESSTQSLGIDATAGDIMTVIADFPGYPQWADAIKSVEVTDDGTGGRARRVRFDIDAGLVKDSYELEYRWAADELSVTWDLVDSRMQKAQHGSYVLRPVRAADHRDGPHTEVTYSLSVELAIPLIGVLRRKAERVIMSTALAELRTQVEGRS